MLGFLTPLSIGLMQGLVGAGGGMLAVPIMCYWFSYPATLATAYSLFVIGVSCLVGVRHYMRRRNVDYKIAALYGVPSLMGVFIARKWLLPSVPDPVSPDICGFCLTKDSFILMTFAALMIFAGWSMVHGWRRKFMPADNMQAMFAFAIQGFLIGILTGFVGSGGGFLIIPALVIFAGLDMKMAIGTSLIIVAVKSLVGFCGDLTSLEVDWTFLLTFSGLSVAGIFIGTRISDRMDSDALKPIFGWMMIGMSTFIIVKEIFF